jgi:hypothetical protein
MAYKDKEKQKENQKRYREANKEKIAEQRKGYYKQYRENNKEKIDEYQKQYNQTSTGIKNNRIKVWKKRGVKLPDDYPDWSLFYDEEYMKATKCEECGVELTEGNRTSTTKCLDHCHITGEFRNILCHVCNMKRK